MKGNSILFVIALIVAITMAGSAQAFVTVNGLVNMSSPGAVGEIVTLWLDEDPLDNTTKAVQDGSTLPDQLDYYWFDAIDSMLSRHGYVENDPGSTNIPITIAMFCSGEKININQGHDGPYTNQYMNVTMVHMTVDFVDSENSASERMNLTPCPEPPHIDLNVTEIVLNPDNYHATDSSRLYVNQGNTINATVWNNGTTGAGAFDVCFKDDLNSIDIDTVNVPGGLAAGTSITVTATWTPTCADYPVMPSFPPQSLPITVNVTADCNSAVTESDEGNNTLIKHVPAVSPYFAQGQWVDIVTGVVNNGYKSKNFDCDPAEDPLTQFKYYDLIGGGVEYNVSGESVGLEPTSDPVNNTVDRTHSITLPTGATVLDARLYLYSSINHGAWMDYVGGATSDLEVNFNSAGYQAPDEVYYDGKGFGRYLMNKQTAAFDVTSEVSGSGIYSTTVKNIDPNNSTSVLGSKLVVVYEGADHGDEVQIWVMEGNDWLRSDKTSSKYSVSVAEATATVGFAGTISPSLVGSATLISGTNCAGMGGGAPGANLLFNGNTIKEDAWYQNEAYPGSGVFIEETDVKASLTASGNNMGFEDEDKHGLVAYEAILVVTKGKEPNATVFFEPSDSGADYNDIATVSVWANTSDVIKGGNLYFDYTVGCADVIGYTPNDVDWDFINQADLSVAGKVSIGFGTLDALGRGPGLLHVGDLEIQCCDVAYCETDLVWNSTSKLNRLAGGLVDPLRLEDGTFTCTNLPDLDVTKVYGEQQTGDDYIVHYTVKNIGNADAAAGHTATLHIGESPTPVTWTWIEDMTVPDVLAPGEFYEGTFNTTLTMTIPNDLMKVCADTGGVVMELDETNNCMESFYPAGIEIRVVAPDECVDFQEQFTVDINVDPRNIETYGVQYTLSFNNEVLHAEWQNEGIFLKSDGMGTNVYINTIDNGAGTISYAATRTGTPDGVIDPGTLATIKFTAIQQGADTNLNLSDIVVSNNLGNEILPVDDINDTVCVWENMPPVASGKSMHKYNNDGQKYICKVYFNGSESSDPDGEVVYWRWAYGDGNYGTGELKDHVYQSWNWNGTGYDPFMASLTVTDDGDPHQLDDTMFFDVIVYTAGDANGDGKVNILDATIVGLEWGDTAEFDGDLYWHNDERGSKADLNNDCKVNILDAVIVGTCWGHVAW